MNTVQKYTFLIISMLLASTHAHAMMHIARQFAPQLVRVAPYVNVARSRSAMVVDSDDVRLLEQERSLREDAERCRMQMSFLARQEMKTRQGMNALAIVQRLAIAAHAVAPVVAGVSMLAHDGSLTSLSITSLCAALSSAPVFAWSTHRIAARQQLLQRYSQLRRVCEQESRRVDEKLRSVDVELLRRAYVENEQERNRW